MTHSNGPRSCLPQDGRFAGDHCTKKRGGECSGGLCSCILKQSRARKHTRAQARKRIKTSRRVEARKRQARKRRRDAPRVRSDEPQASQLQKPPQIRKLQERKNAQRVSHSRWNSRRPQPRHEARLRDRLQARARRLSQRTSSGSA